MKNNFKLLTIISTILFLIGCVNTENTNENTQKDSPTHQELGTSYKMETRDTRIGKLSFDNGYPTKETLEKLYDEREFQRACQAYTWSLPAISMMEFIRSYQEDLGATFGDLCHIKGYDDASYGITANATTEYMFGWHDLTLSACLVSDESEHADRKAQCM